MLRRSFPKNGFTLIELMIVVAILALLILTGLLSMRNQRLKAEDARIKADLQRLKIAFEDYYNDNNCYPPTGWFDSAEDCNSEALSPYLKTIPCNPKTDLPYVMETVGEGLCNGYRLYATLQNTSDPSVTDLCTVSGGSNLGNYGVSSSNTKVSIACDVVPEASALAIPSHAPGIYACEDNTCKNFGPNSCAVSFSDADRAACEVYCPQPGAQMCN